MSIVSEAREPRQGGSSAGERAATLEWEADVSLFRSQVILRQLAVALGIPVLVVVALLVVLDWPPNAAAWRSIGQAGLIVGATLLTLAVLAMGLIYGGKYRFRYRLDDRGITADPSGTTAWKNRIVNLLLVLSGRPSAMGAGLLAQSRQHEEVAWSQVDRVVPEGASRTIVLRRGRRVAMLVACRPDNYDQVLGEIRRRMAPGSG